MKIAIPVEDKDIKSNICSSFGRAPYFLIYDSVNRNNTFLTNNFSRATGGAGIKAAQTVIDSKAEVLLAISCGENAAYVLQTAGINIYKADHTCAKDNINAFIDGKLELLKEIHAGFHRRGGY